MRDSPQPPPPGSAGRGVWGVHMDLRVSDVNCKFPHILTQEKCVGMHGVGMREDCVGMNGLCQLFCGKKISRPCGSSINSLLNISMKQFYPSNFM